MKLEEETYYEKASRDEATKSTHRLRKSGYPSAVTSETYVTQVQIRRRAHYLPSTVPQAA